ncbi:MAG: hypothetical protein IV107_24145 [Paucibacter sp.]|nr:hypothetical protein [Roseateles sp.]
MATIKLGARPKNFKHKITIPLHEGGEGTMTVSFVYRTRSEYGAFIDGLLTDAGVELTGSSDEQVAFSLEQALTKTRDKNADYILKIIDGWNLDSELSRASLVQLCDELPGAAMALMNGYAAAITEGRLGN